VEGSPGEVGGCVVNCSPLRFVVVSRQWASPLRDSSSVNPRTELQHDPSQAKAGPFFVSKPLKWMHRQNAGQ
jgi:hypothetical protein